MASSVETVVKKETPPFELPLVAEVGVANGSEPIFSTCAAQMGASAVGNSKFINLNRKEHYRGSKHSSKTAVTRKGSNSEKTWRSETFTRCDQFSPRFRLLLNSALGFDESTPPVSPLPCSSHSNTPSTGILCSDPSQVVLNTLGHPSKMEKVQSHCCRKTQTDELNSKHRKSGNNAIANSLASTNLPTDPETSNDALYVSSSCTDTQNRLSGGSSQCAILAQGEMRGAGSGKAETEHDGAKHYSNKSPKEQSDPTRSTEALLMSNMSYPRSPYLMGSNAPGMYGNVSSPTVPLCVAREGAALSNGNLKTSAISTANIASVNTDASLLDTPFAQMQWDTPKLSPATTMAFSPFCGVQYKHMEAPLIYQETAFQEFGFSPNASCYTATYPAYAAYDALVPYANGNTANLEDCCLNPSYSCYESYVHPFDQSSYYYGNNFYPSIPYASYDTAAHNGIPFELSAQCASPNLLCNDKVGCVTETASYAQVSENGMKEEGMLCVTECFWPSLKNLSLKLSSIKTADVFSRANFRCAAAIDEDSQKTNFLYLEQYED